jgi:hypothetical protein
MTDLNARFDRDPDALAWARAKVQATVRRYQAFADRASASGDTEIAAQWRHAAGMMQRDLVGGHREIAEFDERLPQLLARAPLEPPGDR